jgi:hypothetical protein
MTGQLAMTEYDEKVSIQSTLFGLPMYKVAPPDNALIAAIESLQAQPEGTYIGDLTLIVDGDPDPPIIPLVEVTAGDDGSYITADGDVQVTAGRPIQPRVVQNLDGESDPVHGVILTGGLFTDLVPFDPVISRPNREWESSAPELQICLPSDWPSVLPIVNTLDTGDGLLQTLVVTPAQFRCTSAPGTPVLGRERLWTELALELQRSPSDVDDFQPPRVSGVTLSEVDETTVAVNVEASDDISGIDQIVILIIVDGETGTATSIPSGPLTGLGPFTVEIPNFPEDADVVVQVVDGAGNVAALTAKGAGGFSLISVDAGPDRLFFPGTPTTLQATVSGFADLTPPVFFTWDFGDESSESGFVTGLPDGSGNLTFVVEHTYNANTTPDQVTATVKVTDANGGSGTDAVVLLRCVEDADAINANADLVACTVNNDDTNMTITLEVDGQVTDEFQYRVRLDIGTFVPGTGFVNDQPDGTPDLHLKYNDEKVTGLPSLTAEVSVSGNEVRFEFSLADIGRDSGDFVQLKYETQAGVKAEEETGKLDFMPDSGFYGYVLR